MKKIGIVTWYFGANYGAVAQAFALSKTIQKFGYECVMVNYKPRGYKRIILRSNIPPKWRRLIHLKKTLDGIRKCKLLTDNCLFDETNEVTDSEEIDNLGLDGLVFGSDAVFNIKHGLWTPIYYGVGIKTPKIAYSPSCEYLKPDTKLSLDCIEALKEFAAISVRDMNTYDLIRTNTTIEPAITLDPTFLYNFENSLDSFNHSNYILIYSFSDWSNYKENIIKYAKSYKMPIVVIGQELSWADYSYPCASFEMWISSFKNAALVITDSFHGTVFSLKNGKQIVLCGRKDKKSKIQALLTQLHISIQTYQGGDIISYLSANEIDYKVVNKFIKEEREKSLSYLKKSLSGITNRRED